MMYVVRHTFIEPVAIEQQGEEPEDMCVQNMSSPSKSWRRLSRAYSDGEIDYDRTYEAATSTADTTSLPECSDDWEVSSECSVVTDASFPSVSPAHSVAEESAMEPQSETVSPCYANVNYSGIPVAPATGIVYCYMPIVTHGDAVQSHPSAQQAVDFETQAGQLRLEASQLEEAAQNARIKARAPWHHNDDASMQDVSKDLPEMDVQAVAPAKPPGNWSCPEPPAMYDTTCAAPVQMAVVDQNGMQWIPVCMVPAETSDSYPQYQQRSENRHNCSSPAPQQEQPTGKPRVNHSKHTRSTPSKDMQKWTTVMLRNVPNDLKRDMLLQVLDKLGFGACYDFVYLPVDFRRVAGLGYAFVNFISHEKAVEAMESFDGFSTWPVDSEKICAVSWGEPLQGLKAHLDRYRNSPVMHPDVQEKFKPVLLKNGIRQPFPVPTKKIRAPRMKRNGHGVPSSCPGFADSDSEEC